MSCRCSCVCGGGPGNPGSISVSLRKKVPPVVAASALIERVDAPTVMRSPPPGCRTTGRELDVLIPQNLRHLAGEPETSVVRVPRIAVLFQLGGRRKGVGPRASLPSGFD